MWRRRNAWAQESRGEVLKGKRKVAASGPPGMVFEEMHGLAGKPDRLLSGF